MHGGISDPGGDSDALLLSSSANRFVETILSTVPDVPDRAFPEICEFWRVLTGARWTWLWFYNPYTETWEISGHASSDDIDYLPPWIACPQQTSVVEYVSQTSQPVYVDDLCNWRRDRGGHTFTVAAANWLEHVGCDSFDAIPLLPPKTARSRRAIDSLYPVVRGALCAHYVDERQRVPHDPAVLTLLGRLTALSIVNSYEVEQREILIKLNDLAERYLTIVNRRPAMVRSDYLREVIEIIKGRLHVAAVTVFYHTPMNDEIECLATTGLRDTDGNVIPLSTLPNVTYGPHEGKTGTCFATGKPTILPHGVEDGHVPKYIESPSEQYDQRSAAILVPIPLPPSHEIDGNKPLALGVIRCSHHTNSSLRNRLRSFDPIEVRTLDFISRLVGPVLETLAVRVQREQTISIVKHDLYAPLNMIRDTVTQVTQDIESNRSVRPYDLKDLGASVFLAQNLVAQLDPDPSEIRAYEPTATFLEGDVVARVQNMLNHYASGEADMRIRFDNFREIPALYVDRSLVERVLTNLLVNAIKYGKRGTTIQVEARRTSLGCFVEVSNYGIGILPDEIPHIFTQHYRSPRAKKQGLGLGLSIAKKAMERMGGRLDLIAPSDPTVFSMYFPHYLERRAR